MINTVVSITEIKASDLPAYINQMDASTREWTMRAAKGECGWFCADCCCSFPQGMPDECCHGNVRCTEIIQRDKLQAMSEGNEPL